MPNLYITDCMCLEANVATTAAMRHRHLPCSGHLPPTLLCSLPSRG